MLSRARVISEIIKRYLLRREVDNNNYPAYKPLVIDLGTDGTRAALRRLSGGTRAALRRHSDGIEVALGRHYLGGIEAALLFIMYPYRIGSKQ